MVASVKQEGAISSPPVDTAGEARAMLERAFPQAEQTSVQGVAQNTAAPVVNGQPVYSDIALADYMAKQAARRKFGDAPRSGAEIQQAGVIEAEVQPELEHTTTVTPEENVVASEKNDGTIETGVSQRAQEFEISSIDSAATTPSQQARHWQGTGRYPGIDKYKDIIVKKDTIIYRGEPNGTNYFTTKSAIERCHRNAKTIFEGLQVEKHPIHGYRKIMQGYRVITDIKAAFGLAKNNPQFGDGGLPQIFIPDVDELLKKGDLIPVSSISLQK